MNVVEEPGSSKKEWGRPTKSFHAHFDCFSGCAGDMLFASCLDASGDPDLLLEHVKKCISCGLPELVGEFEIEYKRVWRGGMGSIAALHVTVHSRYNHSPAPVPCHAETYTSNSDNDRSYHDDHSPIHEHCHGHSQEHGNEKEGTKIDPEDHPHSHTHNHGHSPTSYGYPENISNRHMDNQEHAPENEYEKKTTNVNHKKSPSKDPDDLMHKHSHGHSHGHSHEHSHGDSDLDVQSLGHSHGHLHSDGSAHSWSQNHKGPLRNFPEIKEMLEKAPEEYISTWVCGMAISAFKELALAEAKTHGAETIDSVHFHEVGAIDSIVDTVGTLIALHSLGATSVSCSRLPIGEGTTWTDHGLLPVPAPATLRLLVDMPVCQVSVCDINFSELRGDNTFLSCC